MLGTDGASWCAARDFSAVAVASASSLCPVMVLSLTVVMVVLSSVRILSALSGLLVLAPNMMLPRLEKQRAPRSSQRLSSGMWVVMGAKGLIAVAWEERGDTGDVGGMACRGPVPVALGDFSDLGEPRSGPVSGRGATP